MIANKKLLLFFGMLVFCKIVAASSPSDIQSPTPLTGTYTSFLYNKEGGDLNGVEVRLVQTQKGMVAVVQFAEGGPGDVAVVQVDAKGGRIHFDMPGGFSTEGYFDGTLSSKAITGVFHYKGGAKEPIVLPRGKSYWDKRQAK